MRVRDEDEPSGTAENRALDGQAAATRETSERFEQDLGRCQIPGCPADAAITYLGHGVCDEHWTNLTSEEAPPDALRKALGIEVPAVLPMEETMKIPTAGKRRGKRSKPPKSASIAKTQKTTRPRENKASDVPQVVFAFRLSEADRDRIHQAAGPGKATQFVRAAALAAAAGDRKSFEDLVAQARASK